MKSLIYYSDTKHIESNKTDLIIVAIHFLENRYTWLSL